MTISRHHQITIRHTYSGGRKNRSSGCTTESFRIVPNRTSTITTTTKVFDMDDDGLLDNDTEDEEQELAHELGVTTAEVVAAYMADEDISDTAEWPHLHDDETALTDTSSMESCPSLTSPLPSLQETDEILSLYNCSQARCETPSVTSSVAVEDHIDVAPPEQAPIFTIIVNGKPHAHPLRSHPVKEVHRFPSTESISSAILPRTESQSSETSLAESDYEISPTTSSRPLFPPRTDSLMPSSAFLAAKIARPSVSHSSSFISQAGSVTPVTIVSPLSPTTPTTLKTSVTPTQKAVRMLHRRSVSVADLFNTFAGKAMNRSHVSLASQVSPPILIHAPVKSPTTVSIPTKVQTPIHAPTPYGMQPRFRSHTWNASQIPAQLGDNSSNVIISAARRRNASQTSLHSSNQHRKAYVMQGANSSAFSVHSQHFTLDLNNAVSGYDIRSTSRVGSARKSGAVPPATPEETVPVVLKERHFKRTLNLRRANAAFNSAAITAASTRRSGSRLQSVSESSDAGREGMYSSLRPSQMQIDTAAAKVGRSLAFQGETLGSIER